MFFTQLKGNKTTASSPLLTALTSYTLVLVAFGTYHSRYSPAQKYCKAFVPWAYMFVRTEHEYAYTKLFKFAKIYLAER
ncbi:hypothetical protein V7S43_005897 [Phytophthora oleae]|uniref:Uncharacterized protein n=1 Tax=Phytophthora oleae TaxID=2107226 RepID=A0ABD3FRY6_9STRA